MRWGSHNFLSTFFVSIAGIHILIPVSMRLGLVDTPGGRKQHEVHTPLIGGLTILRFTLFSYPHSFRSPDSITRR